MALNEIIDSFAADYSKSANVHPVEVYSGNSASASQAQAASRIPLNRVRNEMTSKVSDERVALKDLRRLVAEAQGRCNADILAASREADGRVAQVRHFVSNAIDLDDAAEELSALKAEAVEFYLRGTIRRNVNVVEESSDRVSEDIERRKKLAIDKLRRARSNLPPSQSKLLQGQSVHAEVTRILWELKMVPVERGAESALYAEYFRAGAFAAGYGDWRSCLRIYREVSRRRVPTPFAAIYMQILQASKIARPVAAHMVKYVLDEAESCGFVPHLPLYHAALDVCRAGGKWRLAMAVLNRMEASGIKPTTFTYSLMCQVGAAAKDAEPHEIYTAMKMAGMPSLVGTTAASALASKYTVTDTGAVRDWLG